MEDKFLPEWESYLKDVSWLINKKIKFLKEEEKLLGDQSARKLTALSEDIIQALCSPECSKIMKDTVIDSHPKVARFILTELSFFHSLIKEIKDIDYANSIEEAKNCINEKEINFALNSARTIKDSIEKIFGLPRWLRNILEILNEILGIIK